MNKIFRAMYRKVLNLIFYPNSFLFYIFHGLVFVLFLYPYLESQTESSSSVFLFFINSLVVCGVTFTVAARRKSQMIISIVIGALSVLFHICTLEYCHLLSLLASTFLYLHCILLLLPCALTARSVSRESVFAAFVIYFLIGLTWSILYQITNWLHPGSFHNSFSPHLVDGDFWGDYIYFSFTTLTTLGYGDIVPISSQARILSIMEAMTGVLFVGAFISHSIILQVHEEMQREHKSK